MAIKIISTTPIAEYNLGHVSIDLRRKTAVLLRQSMKNADKDHYESRLMQENLVPIAVKIRGEATDENILVYDEGAGISGTKGYDEREKLSQLYLDIANDVIGSLLVARPDRLFRDKHFLNVSMFTDLAERKKLILIVPGKCIYDFTKYNDLKAFQKDMQDAYSYIATHVQYMNDARSQKMQRGLWGGGSLTAPYVIDKAVWKDEQVPIIYKPWLEQALDLFVQFKACDFSTSRVCRYIESLPYVFPVPSYEDTQRYIFRTNMRLVSGGYTFSDVSTVRYFLSNLTLGGYAKVGEDEEGNELLVPDAFEAAIPFDLLDPAYAAITGHHIDGALFEGYKNKRRYTRSEPQGPRTLFQGNLLTSDQGHISADIRENKGYYECFEGLQQEGYMRKLRSGLLDAKILWVLPARSFDQLIADRLCDLARHDSDIAERVKAAYEGQKGPEINETKLLQGQIERTQQQIQRLDFLLKNPNIPLDEETAKGYAKDLAELRPKLTRLIKKQQAKQEIDPGETITNFYFVLSHLPTEFKKQSIDLQRQIMSKLVKQVVVNNISPHLFRLYVVWQDGVATRPDVALLWRGKAVLDDEGWKEEEDTSIRSHFATAPQPDIMRLLPTHTWTSIRQHANDLGIIRSKELKGGRKKVNSYYETTSYADFETAMKYAENGEDKAYMCEKVNELAEKTPRGQISPYWPLPVEIVSFSSFVSEPGEWST